MFGAHVEYMSCDPFGQVQLLLGRAGPAPAARSEAESGVAVEDIEKGQGLRLPNDSTPDFQRMRQASKLTGIICWYFRVFQSTFEHFLGQCWCSLRRSHSRSFLWVSVHI